MTTVTYEELESSKTKYMIRGCESFEITGLSGRMGSAVSKIENIIENQSLSCRVYTYGRVASAGATLVGGITGLAGLASVVGMAVHNIATYNPDYEMVNNPYYSDPDMDVFSDYTINERIQLYTKT